MGLSSLINQFHLCRQIPLFSSLRWYELTKIARKTSIVEYRKGETIRKQGDPPDFFYCLVSGRIQSYSERRPGFKENVDFIHRGTHFGVLSVMTGEPHSSSYEAINDSVVLKIPKDDFQNLLKSIPGLALELTQSLSRRIRYSVQGTKNVFESTIISIYSPVKGTGSSTYAINLALSLQKETGKKVMMLNIQTSQNHHQNGKSVIDNAAPKWETPPIELRDIMGEQAKVMGSIKKGNFPVDLLNVVFDATDTSLKKQVGPLVSMLVGDYHYVIVDLPNDMDDFVLETLTQSDAVHLLAKDTQNDLDQIRSVIDSLEVAFKEKFQPERIHVIIRTLSEDGKLSYEDINKTIDFNIYTILPNIKSSQLNTDVQSKDVSIILSHENSEYSKAVRRIAREIGGVTVGLVLGGGAALGVAHIGVIRVLEENHIPIDMVVGSSMGALIAAIWATGRDSYELEKVAREFENQKDMLKLFDPVIPISGLVAGRAISRWLYKHLNEKTFHSTRIPLRIIAYDLIRRDEMVIQSGSLVDAVRKSISIPGVIEPVLEKDQVIIDGGVLNPLPTNVLVDSGIKKIIAVNVLQSPEHVSQGHDLLKRKLQENEKIRFTKAPGKYLGYQFSKFFSRHFGTNISDIIVRTLQATEYVIAMQSAQQANIVLHPDLVGINWFELNKVSELIKAGEDVARLHLPEIKKLVGRVNAE